MLETISLAVSDDLEIQILKHHSARFCTEIALSCDYWHLLMIVSLVSRRPFHMCDIEFQSGGGRNFITSRSWDISSLTISPNPFLQFVDKTDFAGGGSFKYTYLGHHYLGFTSIHSIMNELNGKCKVNIASGTTDPEIDSVTWIKFINNMAPLALVAYLATRWRHLH